MRSVNSMSETVADSAAVLYARCEAKGRDEATALAVKHRENEVFCCLKRGLGKIINRSK